MSVNILKNNTLIYSAVAQGDWLTASKRMVENVGQDWNSDIAYYKVQSVSKKASKTPMPVIDNTNAVSTIFSLIAAPFQALASVASSLGPDYVTVNATVKDTFNLSYQFFYRLHLTENAAEAFDFYYFLQNSNFHC